MNVHRLIVWNIWNDFKKKKMGHHFNLLKKLIQNNQITCNYGVYSLRVYNLVSSRYSTVVAML